jgi:hypothetical protein
MFAYADAPEFYQIAHIFRRPDAAQRFKLIVNDGKPTKFFPAPGTLVQMLRNLDSGFRVQDLIKIFGK